MSKRHGNSHQNEEDHHLYAIIDKEDNDVVKYGISSDTIDEDGLSNRIRRQLNLYNALVGVIRFFAKIIVKGIKGRKEAEKIENEHIENYDKEHGQKPRANLK